jgi:hypothetical protein
MIDAAAKQMADQFFAAFRAQLAPDAGEVKASSVVADLPGPALTSDQSRSRGAGTTHASEHGLRMKWFTLGALSCAIVIWLGSRFY